MATIASKKPSIDSLVAGVLDEYRTRLQNGERPSIEDYVRQYPDHATLLRNILTTFELLDVSLSGSNGNAESDVSTAEALGDYRIIREVGRGGMGVVYEAQQISLGRRVALKVLPFAATMDPRHLQRFKNEAMAAASLEHPNIVPVYGVGSERGVHFYAMKFIDGRPLTDVIRPSADPPKSAPPNAETVPVARAATVPLPRDPGRFRQIAEWGIQAAEALEHAHSLGVVHRDVKPGNLLIDGQGKLWVADFGLAKMGTDAGVTMTGDVLGTLRYMSPEQALAKHGLVDHRTDVYSLGATLYELLTGQPAAPGEDKHEVLRRIAFEEPVKPRAITGAIPKDLETICLKCLEKEPSHRYQSAGELALDIGHWLQNKPIIAKSPTVFDRLAKWAWHRRGLLALVGSFLIVLSIGLSVAVILLAKKNKEVLEANEQAGQRLVQLDRSNDVLSSLVDDLNPYAEQKGGPSLHEQLKLRFIKASDDLESNLIGDSLVVATLQKRLGNCLVNVDAPQAALKILNKALSTRQELLGPYHEDTLRAKVDLGAAYKAAAEYQRAVALLEQSLEDIRARIAPNHDLTLNAMNYLAQAYQAVGKRDSSIALTIEARSAYAAKYGPNDSRTLTLANNLGMAYLESGQHDLALPLLDATYKARIATLGPDHIETLICLNNLATGYWAVGKMDKAVSFFEESHRLTKAKLGPDHWMTLDGMSNLAAGYEEVGKPELALPLSEEAFRLARMKYGPEHTNTISYMHGLAVSYLNSGKPDAALPLFTEAFQLMKLKLGVDHPETIRCECNLADTYRKLGKPELALPLAEESLAMRKAKLGRDHPETLHGMNNLGGVYRALKELDKAIVVFDEAVRLGHAKLGSDHPDCIRFTVNLATACRDAGQIDRAISLLEPCCPLVKAKLGAEHRQSIDCVTELAKAYQANQRFDQAAELYREVVALKNAKKSPDDTGKSGLLEALGVCLLSANRPSEAEPVLKECLELLRKKDPNHWTTINAQFVLGCAVLSQKRFADAEALVVPAYEGLKQCKNDLTPAELSQRLNLIVERIISLYEQWDKPDQAARWKAEKAKLEETARDPVRNK